MAVKSFAATSAPAVRASGLGVSFDGADGRVVALSNISLEVSDGDFVALLGPSGCGKSTLLRTIADLIPPDRGAIEIFGRSAREARLNGEFGFVFQDAALMPWCNVLDNVMLPARVGAGRQRQRDDIRAIEEEARSLIALVGLTGREKAWPRELSGGMRQRVSLARAMLLRPRILLMDEPFGALDEITRDGLNDELLRVWEQVRTTIIFVTHSIAEATYLAKRVVVMATRPGRILSETEVPLAYPRTSETRDVNEFARTASELRTQMRHAS